ncbi:MAG: SAM hydrolase/SAM-dependent halogenase family protein [Desulfotomaculales bacterium]
MGGTAVAAGIVALLTDFGSSVYPGIVRGVILACAPEVRTVDLTHHVSAFAVREGAWLLLTAYRYFPPGTTFLAVVDPGVGSDRQRVAVATRNYFFVGPDNGLLFPAVADDGPEVAVRLPRPQGASLTFEARDVFAPAAARLARGESITSLGLPTSLEHPLLFHRKGREGEVVYVDAFGNIVTNLPPEPGARRYRLVAEGLRLELAYCETYAAAPRQTPFVITGSAGTLEISVREGRAAAEFALAPGTKILLEGQV